MSARRLSVAREDDAPRRLLPDVPAPLRGHGRAHSLAEALEIALHYGREGLGYDAIMGLSGLAFRTAQWPGEPGPDRKDWLRAIELLDAALTGEIAVVGGDDRAAPDEVTEAVMSAIDADRPCIALGWGSVKDEWSVIAGYDQGASALVGHCLLDEPREAYESWPADVELLVTISGEPQVVEEAGLTATVSAAQAFRDDRSADAWADAIREVDEAPGPAHERAVRLLLDSRTAAADLLGRMAEEGDSIAGQWLAEAAGHMDKLVELIEGRGAPPSSPEAHALLADEAGRARWAERLDEICRADERAFSALRRSLTADFGPGDDEF